MTSKLTREQLHERARENVKALKMASRQTAFESAREEILADLLLAELALAAMAGEPVVKKVACWSCQNEVEIAAISDCDGCCPKCGTRIHLDEEPYIAPLSAPDRDQVRQEHAEWSQSTFGNVGPVGPLKHLSKEALEAAAEPGDLSEWADMQFLLWDAQRRAGITDEQITQAMIDKLAVNKQREWPEPKDGEPRLHIKEQPVPVVPKSMSVRQAISALESAGAVTTIGQAYKMGWNACRAAMLQELKKSAGAEAICRSDENVQVLHTKSPAQSDCCPAQNVVAPAQSPIDHGYLPECECAGCKATARICTEMAVNSLVIPDEMTSGQAYEIGYYYGDPVDVFARGANWMRQHIIDSTLAAAPQAAPVVPKEMTAGIAVKHWEGGRGSIESFIAGYNFCRAAILAAAPQEVKGE